MHPVHAVLTQNKMDLCTLPQDSSSADQWLLIVTGTAFKFRSVKENHASPRALQCACIPVHVLLSSQKGVQKAAKLTRISNVAMPWCRPLRNAQACYLLAFFSVLNVPSAPQKLPVTTVRFDVEWLLSH